MPSTNKEMPSSSRDLTNVRFGSIFNDPEIGGYIDTTVDGLRAAERIQVCLTSRSFNLINNVIRNRNYHISNNTVGINLINALMRFQDNFTPLNTKEMPSSSSDATNVATEFQGDLEMGVIGTTVNVLSPAESFEMNVAGTSRQPAEIAAALADQSFEMNVAGTSGQPAQIVAALADQSFEMNVAGNSGQPARIVDAPANQGFEMNVAGTSGQPAEIVAALADQSFEMNVAGTSGQPAEIVDALADQSFEMNVAGTSGQPAEIVAALADQSFEMNVAGTSGQPAQIVAALADQIVAAQADESVEMNVPENDGEATQIVADNSQIVVTWIMGAMVGLPAAHEMLIRYLGDRSEDFKYNHKILEGLSVMSLWAVIVFGVLLSLVFAFPRPRPIRLWFPSACFGFLMCFAVVIMMIELFLGLSF